MRPWASRGRGIRESDLLTAPKVAVVNQQFAHKYLRGVSAIGRRFGLGREKSSADIEIVGVAAMLNSATSAERFLPRSTRLTGKM